MGLEVVVLSSSRVRDWLGLENGESCLFEAGPTLLAGPIQLFRRLWWATLGLQKELATLGTMISVQVLYFLHFTSQHLGLLQIRCPGGHQARAFIARGHELRCGMLWSPRFAVERLRRPAQRTTSSKVRDHQLLGTTTSAPARARLCCRACCPTHSAETGRTSSNSLMINRSGARFFLLRDAALSPSSRR